MAGTNTKMFGSPPTTGGWEAKMSSQKYMFGYYQWPPIPIGLWSGLTSNHILLKLIMSVQYEAIQYIKRRAWSLYILRESTLWLIRVACINPSARVLWRPTDCIYAELQVTFTFWNRYIFELLRSVTFYVLRRLHYETLTLWNLYVMELLCKVMLC